MIATTILALLGFTLGALLTFAGRYLRVAGNPLRDEITAMLPGVNCGQCGLPGCAGAAEALTEGRLAVTANLCPPGGPGLAQQLAAKLGVALEAASGPPQLAWVNEHLCIGCAHCGSHCPTDAIVGASKQLHHVLQEACTGCGKCLPVCPTESLQLRPMTVGIQQWHWPKPQLAGI
ncbi:MAG: RnfABCDGE type electron transport complex subunit B [Synechococcaceae cyanobacterium SM1_2_3]|nr:RnfABCDGE type electron transport complex subunit B [Synechococcaceae cyanobacterium SM1_2_3]